MQTKHLHFSADEYNDRLSELRRQMAAANIDGLLCFRQESMYWLTGYDTFGYVFFQCLVVTADGRLILLTRAPDLRQAHFTSIVDDVRVWKDGEDASPIDGLTAILDEHGLANARLGVEWNAYGMTGQNALALNEQLSKKATLIDVSAMISKLRLVKSETEIAYTRRAAELADDAWDAAVAAAKPGAFEGNILADMHGAIFRGGGDDPANEFIIGSGPGALMCRYFTGRRHLDSEDQLTLEWAGTYRHYHAAMMRTLRIGSRPERQNFLYEAATEALLSCEEKLRAGNTAGDVFSAHARTLDDRGLSPHRMNACGYAMGTTYGPNWMDWPMLYANNPVELQPGMVFFLHMIVFDSDAGLAASVGHSCLVTSGACERLSRSDLAMVQV